MENFSINNNNEFQKNSEGPIMIDGMLSAEELSILETALAGEKNEIHEATSGHLSRLIHEDIIPNIGDFNAEVQKDLLALSEKHPKLDLGISIPEDLSDTLSQDDLNLSLQDAIGDIEAYTQNHLGLPPESIMNSSEHATIIANLGEVLQSDISGISAIVQEKIDDNSDKSLAEMRWIINGAIKDFLSDFKNKVLFPTKQLIEFSSESHREATVYKEMEREAQIQGSFSGYEGDRLEKYIEGHVNSSKMHFNFAYEQFRSHIVSGDLNPQSVSSKYSLLFGLSGWADPDIRTQELNNFNNNIDVTLLNEEDIAIERNAMMWFMGAMAGHLAIEGGPALLASVVPGAGTAAGALAGGVLGAGIDITDIFSSEEALLQMLKKAGVVPDEYHMEKTLIDNIVAGIGLIPGVTLAVKSAKLAELMAKFGVSGNEVLRKMEDVLPVLRGDSKKIDFSPQVANINRAPIEATESGLNRTIRHQSTQEYTQNGGRSNEYGYVDSNGQLHINTQMFEGLSNTEKSRVMREFIAHERSHQAILNFPEGKLREIHTSFIKNDVFSIVQEAEKYGLHFRSDQNPLDTTNEILAHMVGRMRVGKEVPDSFMQALEEAGIHDIHEVFGVNTSRSGWAQNSGVQNTDNLADAAMSGENFSFETLLGGINIRDASAEDILSRLGDNLQDTVNLIKLEEDLGIFDYKLVEFIQQKQTEGIIDKSIDIEILPKEDVLALFKSPLEMSGGELASFLESATGIAKRILQRQAPIIKNNIKNNEGNIVGGLLDSDKVHSTYETLGEEDFIKVLNALAGDSMSRSDREKIIAGLKVRSAGGNQIGSDTVAGVVETTEVADSATIVPDAAVINRNHENSTPTQAPSNSVSTLPFTEVLEGLAGKNVDEIIQLLNQSDLKGVSNTLQQIIDRGENKWFQEGGTIYIIMNGKISESSSSGLSNKIGGDINTYFREQRIGFLSNADRGNLSGDLLSQAIHK